MTHSRRQFLRQSLSAIAFYPVLASVTGSDAWASPIKPIIRTWILRLGEFGHSVQKLGAVAQVPWPEVEGFPKALRFGHKLFVYRKGSVTPPHAHNYMVSAHLILRGEVRTRTFHRVQDLETSILLKPTRDEIPKPGTLVTMSDERDNVHWFEGVSERSISFDIPVVDINPDKQYRHPAEVYNQIYLDPTGAPRADGTIEAPIIEFRDSVRKFA